MPDQGAAERTEQPTPRRLEKARSQGTVPHSQELASVATLFALVAALAMSAPSFMRWVTGVMTEGMSCQTGIFADQRAFLAFISSRFVDSVIVTFPILAAICAAGIAAGVAVGGLNFAPGAVSIKFDSINPAAGLQRLLNGRNAVALLASVLKLFFVTIIVITYLMGKTELIAKLRWAPTPQILPVIAKIIFGLCIRICIALLIIAIADALYQKWKHIEDLKMTRQEVRQEHRDLEGAPEVKARIRKIQLQMSMKRMLQEVPKANVVLVNPTHVAVALKYDSKTMESPLMVAKGADHLAEKIMEIARAYGVPIVRRPELARTIYSTVEVGNSIPQNLYIAVAEVLAMLHRLRHRKR